MVDQPQFSYPGLSLASGKATQRFQDKNCPQLHPLERCKSWRAHQSKNCRALWSSPKSYFSQVIHSVIYKSSSRILCIVPPSWCMLPPAFPLCTIQQRGNQDKPSGSVSLWSHLEVQSQGQRNTRGHLRLPENPHNLHHLPSAVRHNM